MAPSNYTVSLAANVSGVKLLGEKHMEWCCRVSSSAMS